MSGNERIIQYRDCYSTYSVIYYVRYKLPRGANKWFSAVDECGGGDLTFLNVGIVAAISINSQLYASIYMQLATLCT